MTRSSDAVAAPAVQQVESLGTDGEFRYEISPDVVAMSETRAAEAEAIRTVRTHLVARHLQEGRRSLAICAASSGAGCTFTAVNLAVALAQAGVATLLIDGDLRTPQVDKFIRPLAQRPGLRDCLAVNGPTLSECIHPEVLPNLSILYSGGAAANPQELLAGETFKRVIDRCLRDFEFTIVDTTAADVGADERLEARMVGYALIVARTHVSRMSELSTLTTKLQEDGVKVVGTVLNDT
ncbi:CpsD/CapB family tyrosine-protein kinase [Phenylobacterium sp.]|uniref:CpsD/CapB family tyrosine-protein kinase n=1 Tax=Phenylobacterium sp. TaxID=1871053 RepID=UPI0025FA5044|nr:CpsD/CapB family tyrosine-protein kinase [Phenylobacterium sp.]MBX3483735.1 CpsD/CapB family tyrosine-protein kinase [Phenylobacterium sp.]MCW5758150.1 CpsD/CapB family tyrosine-protein kinase [Phenylobacterium sp.]